MIITQISITAYRALGLNSHSLRAIFVLDHYEVGTSKEVLELEPALEKYEDSNAFQAEPLLNARS